MASTMMSRIDYSSLHASRNSPRSATANDPALSCKLRDCPQNMGGKRQLATMTNRVKHEQSNHEREWHTKLSLVENARRRPWPPAALVGGERGFVRCAARCAARLNG